MTTHAESSLAATIAATMQQAVQRHRIRVETLAEQSVRDGNVLGFIALDGPGEAVAAITFPVSLLERPVFTFGLELADNTWLEAGNFPLVSAAVTRWDTREANGSTTYLGATLGIVVIGPNGPSSLHYSFQARSFTNPTAALGLASDPI